MNLSIGKASYGLVSVIACLLIFSSTAAASSQVILQPSSKMVSADNPVDVDVFVVPDTEIAGVQFDLEFDSSVLQVVNVTEGDLFKKSGRETCFNTSQTDEGTLKTVYGCVLGKGGVSIPGTFATVTLASNSDVEDTVEICLKNVIISSPESIAVDVKEVNTSIKILKTEEQESFFKKLLSLFS